MLIGAKRIPLYLRDLEFPVDVLAERSGKIAFVLQTQEELLALCEVNAVVARGTYNRIYEFQVNRPIAEVESLRLKLHTRVPTAEDSRTVERVHVDMYSFHPRRSRAYSPASRKATK